MKVVGYLVAVGIYVAVLLYLLLGVLDHFSLSLISPITHSFYARIERLSGTQEREANESNHSVSGNAHRADSERP
jgi:hypothetical protein